MCVDWLHYTVQEQTSSGCFSMYLCIYSAVCFDVGKHAH